MGAVSMYACRGGKYNSALSEREGRFLRDVWAVIFRNIPMGSSWVLLLQVRAHARRRAEDEPHSMSIMRHVVVHPVALHRELDGGGDVVRRGVQEVDVNLSGRRHDQKREREEGVCERGGKKQVALLPAKVDVDLKRMR